MKKSLIAGSLVLSLLGCPALAAEVVSQKQEAVQAGAVVQVTPQLTEEQALDMVKVETTPIFLQSHIAKRFSAYKISVTNSTPGNLDLTSGSIENGVPGTIGASSTSTSYGNILWGLPLWLLGMGVAALIISGKNNKAETESFQFPNQVPTNTLHKNEAVSFNALVPLGQRPKVRMSFKNNSGLDFVKTVQ